MSEPTAMTKVRAGTRHTIRFSNCDDELLLWVDGDLVAFDSPTTFNSLPMRSDDENHPQFLDTHPLDAAPAGIAVRGGQATVRHLRIDRDKYYIATQDSDSAMIDYDMNGFGNWPEPQCDAPRDPALLESRRCGRLPGWSARRRVTSCWKRINFSDGGQ